jgi:hypothetical protein
MSVEIIILVFRWRRGGVDAAGEEGFTEKVDDGIDGGGFGTVAGANVVRRHYAGRPGLRQTMPCQVPGKMPVRIFIGLIGAPARVDRGARQGAILSGGGGATRGVFGRFAKACISGAIVL